MGFGTAVWTLFVVFTSIFIVWARSDHGRTAIERKLENDPIWARRRIVRKKTVSPKRPAALRRESTSKTLPAKKRNSPVRTRKK